MSDTLELDETADEAQEQQTGKGLRAQLEAALKAKEEIEKKYTEAAQQARQAQIESAIAARGANPKIAQFVPEELGDVSGIAAWLDENADIFAPPGTPQQQAPKPGQDQAAIDAAKKIQSLGSTPPPNSHLSDIESRIANADSAEEVQALWGEAAKYLL
jgi:hypothetical protein